MTPTVRTYFLLLVNMRTKTKVVRTSLLLLLLLIIINIFVKCIRSQIQIETNFAMPNNITNLIACIGLLMTACDSIVCRISNMSSSNRKW